MAHGLGDLVAPFVVRDGDRWLLATYVFPADRGRRSQRCKRSSTRVDPSQTLTGLPLVNRELARRFLPEFLKGWRIGTVIVVAARRRGVSRLAAVALRAAAHGGRARLDGRRAGARAASSSICSRIFAVVTFVGIGVDYGVHLVHRFQERGDAGRARPELAPGDPGGGAITLLGYGTLITSSYPPLRSIGVVSAVSVVALAAASRAGAAGAADRGRRG